MRWKICGLHRIELCDLFNSLMSLSPAHTKCISCLRDKRDQLPKMRGLFLRMDLKYLTRRVVMVPLLQEFFFVRNRVSLDEVLKLGEVGRA